MNTIPLTWVDLATTDLATSLAHYVPTLKCGAQKQDVGNELPSENQNAIIAAYGLGFMDYWYFTMESGPWCSDVVDDQDQVTPMPPSFAGIFPSAENPVPGWRAQWHVTENLELTVTRLRRAGCSLIAEPASIMGMANMSLLIDPYGLPLFLWQPTSPREGAEPARLLGVTHSSINPDGARLWYKQNFPIIADFDRSPNAESSGWVPSFWVEKLNVAAEKAAYSGTIVYRSDSMAIVADCHGHHYKIME